MLIICVASSTMATNSTYKVPWLQIPPTSYMWVEY
jgi:hypothetical protein